MKSQFKFIHGIAILTAVMVSVAGCSSLPSTTIKEGDVPYGQIAMYNMPCNEMIVAAPSFTTQDRSDEHACYEAACRIAMSRGLYVFSGQVNQSVGKADRITSDFSYHYDDAIVDSIAKTLSVTARVKLPDGQYLITVKGGDLSPAARAAKYNIDASYFSRAESGAPRWIKSLPVLPSYLVAYGTVNRHRMRAEGFFAADLAAATALVRLQDSNVRNYSLNKDATFAGTADVRHSGGVSLAAGAIEGFFIIDRWIDPETGDIYTLALCNAS